MCKGVYQIFSNTFGRVSTCKPRRQRKHARLLKRITAEKIAKQHLRQAQSSSADSSVIQELARNFYRLVRLHSAEKKILLKSKCRFEALKARRECSKAFWCYAAKLLDDVGDSVSPTFDASKAEEYFTRIYAAGPNQFSKPTWLSSPPTPSVPFNDGDIMRKSSKLLERLERIQQLVPWMESATRSLRDAPLFYQLFLVSSVHAGSLELSLLHGDKHSYD